MSTDTKYQVMGELLGIHAAAIEKAEEQAGRIIAMVKGGCSCSIPCGKETLTKLKELFPSEPEEDFSASLKIQPAEFTAEDLSYLKDRGHTWAEIGAEAGISQDAARKRVMKWRAKQQEMVDRSDQSHQPLAQAENDIEPISDEDLPPLKALIKKIEPMLYEPGAEEARQEAEDAEATIRKSLTVEEQIGQFIRGMIINDPNAMDLEIMHAVHRNFAGVSISVKDIAAQRRGIA